jgi:5-methylcytosine-specific restriction endonuclease McrA
MVYESLLYKCALYAEATGERNEYMRDYMADRYHAKRQAIIDRLGGKCKSCGAKDHLHIDHKDRKKKTFRAADIHSVSDEKVEKEIPNLQLLCNKCHKKKTHDAWDYSPNTPKPRHGTVWMYRKYDCRCPKCIKAYREYLDSRSSR